MVRIIKEDRKYSWYVEGEYGGQFINLTNAKECAKYASTTKEYNYKASIYRVDDGCHYIEYENGKLVRDGWNTPETKLTKTGKTAKFNLDGKLVEKPLYKNYEGKTVIRHNGKILVVSNM